MKLNFFDWLTLVLVIVGGLNWGLIGALDFDFVTYLLGDMSVLSRVVYILVGISALYVILMSGKLSKKA